MTSEQNVPGELDETQWLSRTEALEQAGSLTRTDLGSEPAEETPPRYGFRVGRIGLLIRPDCISEVVKPPPIHPIPNTPAWLNGILNLRGNLVPAFDLALMLDESVAYERPLLLVIDRGEWAAGVKIDGFPQPLGLSPSQPRVPPVVPTLRDHVSARYAKDGTVWLEFDHRGFFESACRSAFDESQQLTGDNVGP